MPNGFTRGTRPLLFDIVLVELCIGDLLVVPVSWSYIREERGRCALFHSLTFTACTTALLIDIVASFSLFRSS